MENEILNALAELGESRNVRILYACESGSRAWGFPSPDSDYDVRFIYVHKPDRYMSVFERKDVIDLPINDLLDIGGWDIRKSLSLLYKSNGPLIEWLHSPIVYLKDREGFGRLQELAVSSFQPLSVCHHYLGMAKKGWAEISEQESVKLKRYFYTLRSLLCCEWIIKEKSIPPVEFKIILEKYYPAGDFRDAIDQLLSMKHQSNEADKTDKSENVEIFNSVDIRITKLFREIPENFPSNPKKVDSSVYDEVFRSILKSHDSGEG
jgi:predicted nucleotidyltransferase